MHTYLYADSHCLGLYRQNLPLVVDYVIKTYKFDKCRSFYIITKVYLRVKDINVGLAKDK